MQAACLLVYILLQFKNTNGQYFFTISVIYTKLFL